MSEVNAESAENSQVIVGLVDGSTPASTRRFHVVLADDAVAQLDELVATTQTLPDGSSLTHYGIVVEGAGQIEGAELPSDTGRITRNHAIARDYYPPRGGADPPYGPGAVAGTGAWRACGEGGRDASRAGACSWTRWSSPWPLGLIRTASRCSRTSRS